MKILKIIVIALAILLVLVVGISLLLPSKLDVKRTIEIDAPANVPFSQVAYLPNRVSWDPWLALDSNVTLKYGDIKYGLGAQSFWESELENVGKGSMEIIGFQPFNKIDVQLNFMEQGLAQAFWEFENLENGRSKVTWGFQSDIDMPILGPYLVFLMGPMIESSFDEGLNNLKSLCESMKNKVDYTDLQFSIEDIESSEVLYIAGETTQNPTDISSHMGRAFGKLGAFVEINSIETTGNPICITINWGDDDDFKFEAAFPVNKNLDIKLPDFISKKSTYSGKALKVTHKGNYNNLYDKYNKILAFIEQTGLQISHHSWEEYLNSPEKNMPDDLITNIYFPIEN